MGRSCCTVVYMLAMPDCCRWCSADTATLFGLCGLKCIPGNAHAVHAIMLCRQSRPQAPFCKGCLATQPAYLHAACTQLAAPLLGCWQPRGQGRGKAKFTGSCVLAATQKHLSGDDRQASRASSWTAPFAFNTASIPSIQFVQIPSAYPACAACPLALLAAAASC